MERCSLLVLRPPQQPQHSTHHKTLVDVIPRLHHHAVQAHAAILYWRHQELVVQTAHGTQYGSTYNHKYPVVVLKVDALLLAATTQQQERGNGQQHTYPLPMVQALAKHQQRTHQHHHRTCGVDRSHNRKWQMLHAEIAQNPARQHDERLEQDILVHIPTACRHMEYTAIKHLSSTTQHYERQEKQT